MPAPAIKIENLTVILGKTFQAIDNISADLPADKITGIIGPSGAGKTTLIRSIVGRQHIAGGSINVFNSPAGASKLREQISYMTQEGSVYSDLTVRENLKYFAVISGVDRKELNTSVDRVLGTVDLVAQADQLVEKLSSGQKRRVSLGIALIGRPRLMVLDEPTVGLDPVLREKLWELFRTIASHGTTLVISSHVMDEAERCDALLLIRDGKLLAFDSPAKIRHSTGTNSIEQSFLKLVGGEQ